MENKTEIFVELVEKYDQGLTIFAKSFVKSHEIAQEIVSDVFFELWERDGIFSEIKNMESFLFISTKNHCLNFLKSRTGQNNKQTEQAISFDFLVENYDPEQALMNKEVQMTLDNAIETLPHSCKVVFNLVKLQGMRQKQVAEIMNISVRTVENQVSKAIKKLRITLQEYDRIDDKGNNRSAAFFITLILFQSIQLIFSV